MNTERIEVFKVRPRLRIGNGQMLFITGGRAEVERVHRRSMGITEKDEINKALGILEPHTVVLGLADLPIMPYRVVFGASLEEWMFKIDEKSACFSIEWGRVRGLLKKEQNRVC